MGHSPITDAPVTIEPNLLDRGLSLKAIGLVYAIKALSRDPDWRPSVESVRQALNNTVTSSGRGRDAIITALAELEDAGLLRRRRAKDGSGRLAGAEWTLLVGEAA